MIKEQFGFGVNEVSLKGAGKLYEVLAQNSAGQASTARQNAGTAFQQYSQGMADFNNYFRASQNTQQAANQTMSQANQAMNVGMGAMNNAGKRALAYNVGQAQDTVTAVNSMLQSGNAFAATLTRSQLQEGMVEGMKQAGEISLIQDPDAKKGAIESFLTEYQKAPDNAYNQGMSRSIFPLYAGAVEAADVKRREIGIRSMLAMADNSYVNSGDKLEFNLTELHKFAKANNLSMGEFRDALYSTVGGTVAQGIAATTDMNGLNKALEKWNSIKEINFNNDQFIKTKNLGTAELIGKTDRNINLALAQAQSKIKTQAQTDWVTIGHNPKSASSKDLEYVLANMDVAPIEREKKIKTFQKQYADQAVDEQFRTEFSTTLPSPYWEDIPATTKKAAEERIGSDGAEAFLFKQPDRMQSILQAHPGHTKAIGTTISKIFDNGTGQEKGVIYDSIMVARETTTSSQMLSQVMEDGKLGDILTIGSLAKSMGGSTEQQINDNWDKATQMLANATGTVGMKIQTNKDLYSNVVEAGMKMGENSGRFYDTMNKLYIKNPEVADKMFDTLKDYYENLSDKNSYSGKESSFDVIENFAHGSDPFSNIHTGLPEDIVDESKGKFLEYAKAQFVKEKGYDPEFTAVTYLGGGIVSLKDGWTNEVMSVPTSKFIKLEREAYLDKQQIKAMAEKESFKNVSEMTLMEAFTNVGNDAVEAIQWYKENGITRSK